MSTKKQSIFRSLNKQFKSQEFSRKDIQIAVWVAQGFDKNETFGSCTDKEGVSLIRTNNKNILARQKATREANRKAMPPHILHADKFQHLSGLTITRVRYMTPNEMQQLAWGKSSIVFEMSDGSILFPQMDDEGNDGGAMAHITEQGVNTIYTI